MENTKYPHSVDQFLERKILEDDPNIYTKERFSYYSQVVQNLMALGFGALLSSKLKLLFGKYVFGPNAIQRQESLSRNRIFQSVGLSYQQMADIHNKYMSPAVTYIPQQSSWR